jgi:ClpP class serine protease
MDLITLHNNKQFLIHESALNAFDAYKNIDIKALSDINQTNITPILSISENGLAIIKITGAMLKDSDVFTEYFGIPTYDSINRALTALEGDTNIKAIILEMNTGGGLASGLTELSETINTIKEKKPIYAYVSDVCYSAGYFLASQCTSIFCVEAGAVGSIGTIISYSTEKDSNIKKITSKNAPKKALDIDSKGFKDSMQSRVDACEAVFLKYVASGRDTTIENVIENYGQGDIVMAEKALEIGMIDGITTLKKISLQILQDSVSLTNIKNEVVMSKTETKPSDVVDVDKIKADSIAEGVQAERTRINCILALDNAKENMALTNTLIAQGLDVDSVKAILGSIPKTSAQAQAPVALAPATATEPNMSEKLQELQANLDALALNAGSPETPKAQTSNKKFTPELAKALNQPKTVRLGA